MSIRLTHLFTSVLLLLSCTLANAVQFNNNAYDVLLGDANGDGNSEDIVLVGKEQLILIAASITIPIIIPPQQSYVLHQLDDGKYASPIAVNLQDIDTTALVTPAAGQYNYNDINGDGQSDFTFNAATGKPVVLTNSVYNTAVMIANGGAPAATDTLTAVPNSNHIAIHEYSNFIINDTFTIYNLPSANNDTGEIVPAADTVVILAEVIDLQSTIEVVGPATDIVIVKKDTLALVETINCNNCQFNNVNRVVLANAQASQALLNGTASSVGQFTTEASRDINITNFYAPGALAVDILADTINLSGEIAINKQVNANFTGGYDANLNGSRIVGTGAVGLFMGWLNWDYSSRDVNAVIGVPPQTAVLNGSIKAPSVRIASTANVQLNTLIDSKTDLLSTVIYQGALTVVEEAIQIQLLYTDIDLDINNSISSEGKVDIYTNGNINIATGVQISADYMQLITVKSVAGSNGVFTNNGTIDVNALYASTDTTVNKGNLYAIDTLHLYGESAVLNRYGGKIQANTIFLESEGIVRNGAKTPYENQNESTSLLVYEDNFITALTNQDISLFDAGSIGLFYQTDTNTTDQNYVMLPDNSANIIGNRVIVNAKALENINPYYEFADAQGEFNFKRHLFNQTTISAETALNITATEYVVNSSASLQVNDSQGVLYINAPLINNERYRMDTTLAYENNPIDYTYVDTDGVEHTFRSDDETESILAKVAVMAPPGRLVSMGGAKFVAGQAVLNNTAYIEVFGDLLINSPAVNSLGISVGGLDKTTLNGWFSNPQDAPEDILTELKEFDTLFFVQGDITATQATGWFVNHEPINEFIENTVDLIVVEDLVGIENVNWIYGTDIAAGTASYDIRERFNFEGQVVEGDTLNISWDESYAAMFCLYGPCTEVIDSNGDQLITYVEASQNTSLFEALLRYYNTFVNSLNEVFNEIDFWNN